MDETIDLRPYVASLLRLWWVIAAAVVAGLIIAAVLHFNQSDYEATALIAVTDPTQQMRFDERIVNTLNLDNLLQAYPELANSDDVMTTLLEEADELSGGEIDTMPELKSLLSVDTSAQSRLLRLRVRHADPQLAAELANAWAVTFVNNVRSIYDGQDNVTFFNDQLAQAQLNLQATERALVEFQSGSRIAIVDNQLASQIQLQTAYLTNQRTLNLILEEIASLQGQVSAGEGDSVTFGDQLTALMIQLRAYETPTDPSTQSNAIQLEVSPAGEITSGQRAQQLALLTDLAEATRSRLEDIDVKLLALEPRIFALQREKQSLSNEFDALTRDRNVANETYLILARKLDEVQIQTDDVSSGIQIASMAAIPLQPVRASLIVTLAVAALIGLIIAVAAIIIFTWWKASDN